MRWPVDETPFWREETVYPCLHYIMPLCMYAATRNVFASIVIVYAWESAERVAARCGMKTEAAEQWDDSWIGDPLIGTLAIVAFGIVDAVYGWREAAIGPFGPPLLLRLLLLLALSVVIVFIVQRWPSLPQPLTWRPELIAVWAAYVAIVLAGFAPFWARHGPGRAVQDSTIVWLSAVTAAIAVALPKLPNRTNPAVGIKGGSVYIRVFVTGLLLLVAALVTVLLEQQQQQQ